jgi:hypothetical protein
VAFRFFTLLGRLCLNAGIAILLVSIWSCSDQPQTLFKLVPPSKSGIDFENTVLEKDTINILTVQYMYHGGGVAAGDFNNDGLTDVFFCGNMVPNRLYLNRGNMRFDDVTEQAGIGGDGKWYSGVALADVNRDGFLDIYVCATISNHPDRRANALFINHGLNENGVPQFDDKAKAYGVADTGYSQNAAFMDYDQDGDLDLYVLTNLESDLIPSNYRPRIMDGSALNNDRLYRNNGDGTFTDVTHEAGILIEGYGLGIAVADFNEDSWPDLYIGNDYISNDVLYINNRDGTFTNEIASRLKHQSLFSMGVDAADINNDSYVDIVTLDMLPEDNLRRKTISGAGATYYNYINNMQYGYEFQYMRNMLQLNNGNGTFSEIGQLAGIHQTDWSWAPLLVDADNDGYRDLIITNGFPKDVTDRDYVMFKRELGILSTQRALIDSIPELKIPNYAFRNNGDLTFSDISQKWGIHHPSFSTGAAFADFDNDGDLDFLISNINDVAFLYKNTLYDKDNGSPNRFLRIRLTDRMGNRSSAGVKITLTYDGGTVQYHDHSTYRGYLSTVEDVAHFGLGSVTSVDTVTVQWPDGKVQVLTNVPTGQMLTIDYSDPAYTRPLQERPQHDAFVHEVSGKLGIAYRHREWDKVDFFKQRTLPHKFSQAGPSIATGDVNGDGLEDFITGKSAMHDAYLFIQQADGSFSQSTITTRYDRAYEDAGVLLFDADGDGDLDLYAVSGSYEFAEGDARLQDRLYRNDGKGKFEWDPKALPEETSSGSCVRAADIDGDGDLDLFVGGRVVPSAYPLAPRSCILMNQGGVFEDGTDAVCGDLAFAGMITDALWTDYDGDGNVDLFVAGEMMPLMVFRNTGNGLERVRHTGLEKYVGLWTSLAGADFDMDGDIDYVAGNLGRNNFYRISDEHPLRVYAKDFDNNGSIDPILSCYFKTQEGTMAEYPVHFWDELYGQSPLFRNQFSRYRQYGMTTLEELLWPYDKEGLMVFTVNYSSSSFVENLGDGTFDIRPLPLPAQFSVVNGIVPADINGDGHLDIVAVGNDYGNEVFSGRYDALEGIVLLGDGRGSFTHCPARKSGFLVPGDAKALVRLHSPRRELLIASQNLDSLRVFQFTRAADVTNVFHPGPGDVSAEVMYPGGVQERIEFYHGAGYLSQSTRTMAIPEGALQVTVRDFSGATRTLESGALTRK